MMEDEPDTSTPDLSTATITELVAELKRRHDCCVFVGEIDRAEDDVTWCRYGKGSYSRIIGMLTRMKASYLRACAKGEREDTNDDDA
jgi:hypothetical protein